MTGEQADEWDVLPETAFAWAYRDAERRKADEEARRHALAAVLAAALDELHLYDPYHDDEGERLDGAPPDDPRMYEGTGIGALYGLPGCEPYLELGDWKLVPRGALRTNEES